MTYFSWTITRRTFRALKRRPNCSLLKSSRERNIHSSYQVYHLDMRAHPSTTDIFSTNSPEISKQAFCNKKTKYMYGYNSDDFKQKKTYSRSLPLSPVLWITFYVVTNYEGIRISDRDTDARSSQRELKNTKLLPAVVDADPKKARMNSWAQFSSSLTFFVD